MLVNGDRGGVRLLVVIAALVVPARSRRPNPSSTDSGGSREQDPPGTSYYALEDFPSVAKRDAHVHINTTDASFVLQAREDNFSLLTINVDSPLYPSIEEQEDIALAQRRAHPDRV